MCVVGHSNLLSETFCGYRYTLELPQCQCLNSNEYPKYQYVHTTYEPRHEKTNILDTQKQRRRSASR